jgi:hypothetical protein
MAHKGFINTTEKPSSVPSFSFKKQEIPASSGTRFGAVGTLLPATSFKRCETESRSWFKMPGGK